MSSPSKLAKLAAMASSEALGSVGSSSTSLKTRYNVIKSSTSEEENYYAHVQAQVVDAFGFQFLGFWEIRRRVESTRLLLNLVTFMN